MGFKILVVKKEDNNTVQFENELQDAGYAIESVSSGKEALEKLKIDDLICLALLDVDVPHLSGYEISRIIKKELKLNISIVLITSANTPEEKAKGLESGADDILVKPVYIPELLARVKNLFTSQVYWHHLQDSYHSVNRVMLYSEQVIDEFDPFKFHAPSVQDELVERFISGSPGITDPEIFMVGEVDEDGNWWGNYFRWSIHHHQVEKQSFALNVDKLVSYLQRFIRPCAYHEEERKSDVEAWEYFPQELSEFVSRRVKGFSAYYRNSMLVMMLNHPPGTGIMHKHNLKSILSQMQLYQAIDQQSRDLREAFIYTARALSRAAEAIDSETGNHILRVGEFAQELASHFYSDESVLNEINYSAWMHDVGKMKIDPSILLKPGPLTKEEFQEMEIHTVYGVVILGDSPYLETARQIALSHHERWDGTGYPYGLKGQEIPLPARVVTLADVYDALRSKRPYKPGFSHEKTCQIILEGDDRLHPERHFCPYVMEAFHKSKDKFAEIYKKLEQ